MSKRQILFLTAFLCGGLASAVLFSACRAAETKPAQSEPVLSGPVCSDLPSRSEEKSELTTDTGLYGTYRSTDGAVLTLAEDGTFSVVSVTVMAELKNPSEDRVQIVETLNGTYSVEGSVCSLQIDRVTVHAEGMDGLETEQIEQGARLLAGNDANALELYTRLLSGDVLTGQELYSEEALSAILQNASRLSLHEAERVYDVLTE